MSIFYDKIEEICKKHKRVAMFVDMDGTIVEYHIYKDGELTTKTKGKFLNGKPLTVVLNNLEEISHIPNIDIYILSLSKSDIIVEEKKQWLRKNVNFIEEKNWIIINKEKGEYTPENREHIKTDKIKEKLLEYDYVIFLDDEHKLLRNAQKELDGKASVYHVSSAMI